MALNLKYLEDADRLLEAGDYVQASEKYWGTAVEMVKAAAESRGWRHYSHRELRDAISRLAEEVDDRGMRRLFNRAEALHANFYENFMLSGAVALHAQSVHELIKRLR